MTSRSLALGEAAAIIARNVPDLTHLVRTLDRAGLTRLAAALRAPVPVVVGPAPVQAPVVKARPPVVKGHAHPDPEMWRTGRIR